MSKPKQQPSNRVYIARPGGKAVRLSPVAVDLAAIEERMQHAN